MALQELSNEPKFVQIGSAISEKHEQIDYTQKKCTYIHTHIHTNTQTYTHTYTHTHISDLDELSRMVYTTWDLWSSVQKSGSAAILYPFYRERQNVNISFENVYLTCIEHVIKYSQHFSLPSSILHSFCFISEVYIVICIVI